MNATPTTGGAAVLALLVTLPALVGVVLLLIGRRADRAAGPLAVLTTAAALLLAVVAAGERPVLSVPFLGVVPGGDLRLAVDGLSAVLVVLVAAVGLLTTVFAAADLPADAARARFCGYFLLFIAAMLTTVTAATLPTLLIAWELMGATSYALIGYRWQEPGKLRQAPRRSSPRAPPTWASTSPPVPRWPGRAASSSPTCLPLTPAGATSPRPVSSSRRWASRPSCRSPPGCPGPCRGPARSARCCTPPPWSPPAATSCCVSSRCWPRPAGPPRRRPGPEP
jgi:hypothetical protein